MIQKMEERHSRSKSTQKRKVREKVLATINILKGRWLELQINERTPGARRKSLDTSTTISLKIGDSSAKIPQFWPSVNWRSSLG